MMDKELLIILNKLQETLPLTKEYYDEEECNTLRYSLVVDTESVSLEVVAYGRVSKYFEYVGV